jgi:hypothetical protein
MRQAQRWQAIKARYVLEGLCDRCAAQAAWAHQDHGDTWQNIHPPCVACQPIVARFPATTPRSPWRKIPHPEASAWMTPSTAVAENHGAMRASHDAEFDVLATTGANR